jgi:NADH:ubiquinone oxidoreductase subunit F (NADH-binding)
MPRSSDSVAHETRIVLENCGRIDPESLDEAVAAGAYQAIAKVLEDTTPPAEVTAEVKRAGLRGRGGAGFPTGSKWSFTAPGATKYIVCNADEGEPGTFKDRLILEGDPHRVLEGMVLAGYAVGASKGYVYIRGEYALSIHRMGQAIADARHAGYLGERVLGSDFAFDVEIKKGAGAYVCGDETALLESIEGKRGYPRIKPPYPGSFGLHGKPTVVNNVETLANVAPILLRGADWFRSHGTEKSPGTKVFTIFGSVRKPGAVETEMGVSLRTLVEDFAGGVPGRKQLKGALIGGAAGAFVGADALDVAMDFDALKEHSAVLGSGAILVLNESVSVVDVLRDVLHFFRHETCGQCAPCRLGTAQLSGIIGQIAEGHGTRGDIDLLRAVASMMKDTSLCPLGQSPIVPIASALDRFEEDFAARIGQGAPAQRH